MKVSTHSYARDKKPKAYNTGYHSYVQQQIGYTYQELVKMTLANPQTQSALKAKINKDSKALTTAVFEQFEKGECFKPPQFYSDAELSMMAKDFMEKAETLKGYVEKHNQEVKEQQMQAYEAEVRRKVMAEMQVKQIDTH